MITRQIIEKVLGEKTLKKTGTGSMRGTVSYYPKNTQDFDWDKVQKLKGNVGVVFVSIQCVTTEG